ncbi:magnesium transporter [Mycoplasmopsis felifaucium]|uniref:Magnesium transporter MgtE n=1 Tax=Mycoplasmopsis felifaucium TaxID=35768 RepID=A0ABZ2RP79_9BACT|nr:magnesium transporter [Mycoplasmopsis felifaucium]
MNEDQNNINELNNDLPPEEEQQIRVRAIKDIIVSLNITKAREFVDEVPNADIAALFPELTLEEQLTFLRLIKTDEAAEIFSYLDEDIQVELAKSFTEDWGMKLLQELQSDELVDVLDELPANVTSKILAYTSSSKRSALNKLLSYNDDEVGSIMSIDISSIPNFYTCEQALNKIRRDYGKNKKELVHYYYVIDNRNKLLGALTLEEIIFAKPSEKIDNLYSPVAYIETSEKKEEAAKVFSEHDMSVLPVVNHEKRLIGMITSDDVIDVIQEEATEDIYKMAGIDKKAADIEYSKTPWYRLFRSRILWVSLLLLLATITQIIINYTLYKTTKLFEQANTANILITISFAAIIPVVIGASNNASIQANVSVSRALALDEIDRKDYKTVVWKELLVGFFIGLVLMILNTGRLGIYFSATKDLFGTDKYKYLALILGTSIALFLSVILSSLFGALIPIAFARAKKDPSSMSSILLNTLLDFITTLIMFGIVFGIMYGFIGFDKLSV